MRKEATIMKNTKQPAPTQEKRIVPDDKILEQLAKLPEDVKKMALGYGYGLMANRKMSSTQSV